MSDVPEIGFDLQYLIDSGAVDVDDPVVRHFPESMTVSMDGLTATVEFESFPGDSFTVSWGDGEMSTIAKSGVEHEYSEAGDYTVTLYAYGTTNWSLTEDVSAAAPGPTVIGTWDVTEDGASANGCCDLTGTTIFNLHDKTGGVHTVAEFNGYTAMTITTATHTRVYTDVTATDLSGIMTILAGTIGSSSGTPTVGQVATVTVP